MTKRISSIDISYRRIWYLAWPIMLANISVPLLGLVDTAILGHLGEPAPLASVAIASQLFTLVLWSVGFLRMGTTAYTAFTCGRQHEKPLKQKHSSSLNVAPSVKEVLKDALFLVVPVSIALGVIVFASSKPLIALFGDDVVVQQGAYDYLILRWWSIPFVLGQYVLIGWAIGLGKTVIPLIMLISSNVINAILNAWFVLKLGWGVEGVAIGSLISDISGFVIGTTIIVQLITTSQDNSFKLLKKIRSLKFSVASTSNISNSLSHYYERIKPMLIINHQLMVRTLVLLLVFTFFTAQGAYHGTHILAANAVLLSLLLLISNGLDGIAHATESLIGQLSGQLSTQLSVEKSNKGLRQEFNHLLMMRWTVIKKTALLSFAMAAVMSVLLIIMGDFILTMLNKQPEVLFELARLDIFLFFLPIVGCASYWLDGVFLGAQRSAAMRNVMVAATLLIFLPVWYGLCEHHDYGNNGLWIAFYSFLIARGVLAIPVLIKLRRSI